MTVILIGNYPLDAQESMQRFALMLERGLSNAGVSTKIWKPKVLLGSFFGTTAHGLGKWVGYIDKWIIFPVIIKWRVLNLNRKKSDFRFHICDHSNAPYLKLLPREKTFITCHDVLAIRGALGYPDAYCSASTTGKYLQRWILSNLSKSKHLIAVSKFTLDQLLELCNDLKLENKNWKVVHNAFNAKFERMSAANIEKAFLKANLDTNKRFILHVGSALPRKNRKLLIDLMVELGPQWDGFIYFAGEPLEKSMIEYASSLGLKERILTIEKPDHDLLIALYSACEAFFFPSFSEGFGWPLIEAQACGAPLITSNMEPMVEVSGAAALYADPKKPKKFAEAFLKLKDEKLNREIVNAGFQNSERFNLEVMTKAYLNAYKTSELTY